MTSLNRFNFTEAQVAKLFQMQDELNTYIHPGWKTQGFDWATAINDECLEILGHLGWKWWKDKTYQQGVTESNKAQIKLELIDILHFMLSMRIEDGVAIVTVKAYINSSSSDCDDLYELTKRMQANVLDINVYEFEIWADMCRRVELTEQDILETYTQKYVLNKFRQDHGYKDGSYVKIWNLVIEPTNETDIGKFEDNEVLSQVVEHLRNNGGDTCDEQELYIGLSLRYHSRLNK